MGAMQCVFMTELLSELQSLGYDFLNDQLKNQILGAQFKMKGFMYKPNNPLRQLLEFYGDPNQLLASYDPNNRLALQAPQTYPLAIEGPAVKPESQRAYQRRKKVSQGKISGNRSTLVEEAEPLEGRIGVKSSAQDYQLVPFYENNGMREISQKAKRELDRIKRQQREKEEAVI